MILQVRCYSTLLSGTSNGDNLTRSAGDNPRRVFLGVSNTVGIDVDFTSYKGKQNPTNLATATESSPWAELTKGYPYGLRSDCSSNPISVNVTSGETAFEVGDASFDSEPNEDSPILQIKFS